MHIKKHLGEIVLRTEKYEEMIRFYTEIIGLKEYLTTENYCFLKISDDLDGHPQVLAIFKTPAKSNGPGTPGFDGLIANSSPLHHFAFTMEKDDFEKQVDFLESKDVELRCDQHFPQKWQSIYLYDPSGNTVEFVCYNKDLNEIDMN